MLVRPAIAKTVPKIGAIMGFLFGSGRQCQYCNHYTKGYFLHLFRSFTNWFSQVI